MTTDPYTMSRLGEPGASPSGVGRSRHGQHLRSGRDRWADRQGPKKKDKPHRAGVLGTAPNLPPSQPAPRGATLT